MRVLVTGFNLQETGGQSGSTRLQNDLPYVLNVMLPVWNPDLASVGTTLRLLRVLMPDGREAEHSAALTDAPDQQVWRVRRPGAVPMISTGLSEATKLIWTQLDSLLQPFEDLTLEFDVQTRQG